MVWGGRWAIRMGRGMIFPTITDIPMTMTTHMWPLPPMPGDDRLRLVQILSPAFPIGGFAYSQGLEQAMSDGLVTDPAGLQAWVRAVLIHSAGSGDAVFLAAARQDGADLADLSLMLLAHASGPERQRELLDQGRAFATLVGGIRGQGLADLAYPVAVGAATAALRVPTTEVLALWLHGIAAQIVSAAVRFLPLGQTEGQRILWALAPLIAALAEVAATTDCADAAFGAFGADMAAMRHETLEVRIFRT